MYQHKNSIAKVNQYEAYELYKKNVPVPEICKRFGVSHQTVYRYIKRVLKELSKVHETDISIVRAELKEQLLDVATEAMTGWQGSKEFSKKKLKKVTSEKLGNSTETEIEQSHGDVRFLEVRLKALETIGQIYGVVTKTGSVPPNVINQTIETGSGETVIKTSWGLPPKPQPPAIEIEAQDVTSND